MMDFRTEVEVPDLGMTIGHKDRLAMLGSCFSDNIGERLVDGGFDCEVNPFGVLYNPESIIMALKGRNDEFEQWVQKRPDDDARRRMDDADVVFVTFGTAWVYRLKETGKTVANCKKQPENLFVRQRLTVDEIVDGWNRFIDDDNSKRKFVFTVSPIRHKRDGMHDNQLSKSTLLLAVDAICKSHPDRCFYFPAYELVMDELRDYRFYADDMVHPSALAVEFVWEKLCGAMMDKETRRLTAEFARLNRVLRHRPFDAESEDYKQLIEQTRKKIKELKYAVQDK